MTNQTIDGVPRELLLRVLDPYRPRGQEKARKELRTLLDATASCDTCGGSGRFGMGFCECCQEAAQPRGEPVARPPDAIIEGVMTSVGITHAIYASTVSLKHGEQVKLYDEQPAPVAVVMPERREIGPNYPYLSDLDIEWNACLDELKRLNPSL